MKKIKQSIYKTLAILLIIVLIYILMNFFLVKIVAMVSASNNILIESTENLELEKYKPTITDDFKDDRIIVTLTSEYSAVNKPLVYQDFKTESLALSQDVELLSMGSDSISKETDGSNKMVIEKIEDLTYINEPSKIKRQEEFSQIVEITLENSGKENVLTAIEELEKLDWVLAAEPSYNYEIVENTIKNDSFYEEQWSLHGINGIQAEQAWEIVSGETTPRLKVGVFETGIQEDHRDLRIIQGNFTTTSSGNIEHGTHVAGIIGAISGNAMGVAGIAPVEIALLDGGNFVSSIVWAINNDIQIINASFHYKTSDGELASANTSHATAIRLFGVYGGIFIAAAGNMENNTDENPQFPAGYADSRHYPNIKNMISVGSINANGERSSFSNYGVNSVQIYAPGKDIYSTLPEHSYGTRSGTSMAAPHVAGVAALLLAEEPTLTASQLKDKILEGADTIQITLPSGGTQTVKKLNAFNIFNENEFETTNLGSNKVQIDGVESTVTGKLVIPQTINGKTVTAIGAEAFTNQTQMTEVVLPNTLMTIGTSAFLGCTALEKVSGGTSVTNINVGSFFNCSALETAEGFDSLINIKTNAFKNCVSLTEITLPKTLKTIDSYAFSGCASLYEVNFRANTNAELQLQTVGAAAFSGCTSLRNFGIDVTNYLDIPTNVTSIGTSSFYQTAFVYISIDKNLSTIGDGAFSGMPNLIAFMVDDENVHFASAGAALYDSSGYLVKYSVARNATTFTIPTSINGIAITKIKAGAFSGANLLTSVNLGNVTSIERNAFLNCTALESLTSAENVIEVGEFALDGTKIYSQAGDFVTVGQVLYRYKGNATILNMTDFPTGITRLSRYAFYWNTTLQTVNLPSQIEYIGNNAFYYCTSLTAVWFLGDSLPDIGTNSFLNVADSFAFYCAEELIEGVTETDAWYAYLSVMEPIE